MSTLEAAQPLWNCGLGGAFCVGKVSTWIQDTNFPKGLWWDSLHVFDIGEIKGTATVDVHPLRISADGDRHNHRSGRGCRIDATNEIAVVWRQSAGPFYLHVGTDRSGEVLAMLSPYRYAPPESHI
jgi:hypothetical protein